MSDNRTGEQGDIPDRNGRFHRADGYWYYSTREGVDIGPFDSREEAEERLGEVIDFICTAEPNVLELLERFHSES